MGWLASPQFYAEIGAGIIAAAHFAIETTRPTSGTLPSSAACPSGGADARLRLVLALGIAQSIGVIAVLLSAINRFITHPLAHHITP